MDVAVAVSLGVPVVYGSHSLRILGFFFFHRVPLRPHKQGTMVVLDARWVLLTLVLWPHWDTCVPTSIRVQGIGWTEQLV